MKAGPAPTLTDRGRVATAAAAAYQDDPTCPDAWAALAKAMEGLVKKEAAFQYRPDPGYDLDDLINAGFAGTWEAVRRFEAGRGVQFTTYAKPWIRLHVTRCREVMSEAFHVPAYRRQDIIEWRRAGCPADPSLAADSRMLLRPESLTRPDGESADLPSYPPHSLDAMASAEESAWFAVMVPRLVEVHRHAPEILRRRLAHAESHRDIGRSLGLTRSRIHQIEALSVRFLVAMAAECGLRDSA